MHTIHHTWNDISTAQIILVATLKLSNGAWNLGGGSDDQIKVRFYDTQSETSSRCDRIDALNRMQNDH